MIIKNYFIGILFLSFFFSPPAFAEKKWVEDELLVQFKTPVWVQPQDKDIFSVSELKNVNKELKKILKDYGVYKIKIQFNVDKVISELSSRRTPAQMQKIKNELNNLRFRYLFYLESEKNLEGLKSALGQFSETKNISYNYFLYPDVTPSDPGYIFQWGLSYINAESAWDISTDASNVYVAVLDGGFQEDHVDLAGNVFYTHDSVNGDSDPTSGISGCDDHGTHVAGIIGAVGNNSEGIAGTFWSGHLMLYQTGSSATDGCTMLSSDQENAIANAVGKGANIINRSVSISESWLDDDVRSNSGVLFINSAGNDATNVDSDSVFVTLSAEPNFIFVANIDSTGALNSSSNYGGSTVHLAAPGTEIVSTLPTDTYNFLSGTSMAAPHVSGVAALAWSQCLSFSASDIKNIILATVTVDTTHLSGFVTTQGYVNINDAVSAVVTQCDADDDGLTFAEEEDLGTDPNDADTDDDGLNDGDEVNVYGTDPLLADTDSDGLTDKEEVDHLACLDPNDSSDGGYDGDADEEGLVNGDEIRTYGTDPCNSDTDSDGLTDKEEVNYLECLDPLDPSDPKNASGDADGDTLTNLEEIRTCLTNPCEADTDNDGLSDRDELLFYDTDPTDKDTDNDGWGDKDEVDTEGKDPLAFDNLVSLSGKNDFNGDGLSDLLAFGDDGNYCVITSTGSQFSHQGQWITGLGDFTSLPITGDFNGDGLTDVGSLNSDDTLSIGLSDGTQFVVDSGWSATGLSFSEEVKTLTGDFNGDGKSDFIVYSSGEVQIFVLSSKTFTLEKKFSIDFDALASADFNGDGFDDLAFLSEGNLKVALSTGTGFDAEEEWLASFYDAATQVFTGDFDADGLEDIWVYDATDKTIKVALSLGDSFRDVGSKLTSSFTDDLYQLANGDFDGDGNPDIFGIYEEAKSWRGMDGDVFLGSGFFFNLDGTWKIQGFKNMMKCQGIPFTIPSSFDFHFPGR